MAFMNFTGENIHVSRKEGNKNLKTIFTVKCTVVRPYMTELTGQTTQAISVNGDK